MCNAQTERLIVVGSKSEDSVPVFCPICDIMMRTADDAAAFSSASCCHTCKLKFVDPDRVRWMSGRRPTSDEVELEIAIRRKLPVGIEF